MLILVQNVTKKLTTSAFTKFLLVVTKYYVVCCLAHVEQRGTEAKFLWPDALPVANQQETLTDGLTQVHR